MRKQILIKYAEGQASLQQTREIELWLEKSKANREYFTALMEELALLEIESAKTCEKDLSLAEKIVAQSGEVGSLELRSLRRRINLLRSVAAVLFLALVVGAGVVYHNTHSKTISLTEVFAQVPKDYLHTIYTNKGVKSRVVLPDSSVVILNSDSKLIFPDRFTGDKREVYLCGEAYFNVNHNPNMPMIVATNRNFVVEVLGTEFNIRSYLDDDKAVTTLYNGSIKLLVSNKKNQTIEEHTLIPNQAFVLADMKDSPIVPTADIQQAKAWTEGKLVFDQSSMEDVIKELQRWHGARFEVEDNRIFSRLFTATFHEESLSQILEVLSYCSDIRYRISEDNVVVLYL